MSIILGFLMSFVPIWNITSNTYLWRQTKKKAHHGVGSRQRENDKPQARGHFPLDANSRITCCHKKGMFHPACLQLPKLFQRYAWTNRVLQAPSKKRWAGWFWGALQKKCRKKWCGSALMSLKRSLRVFKTLIFISLFLNLLRSKHN